MLPIWAMPTFLRLIQTQRLFTSTTQINRQQQSLQSYWAKHLFSIFQFFLSFVVSCLILLLPITRFLDIRGLKGTANERSPFHGQIPRIFLGLLRISLQCSLSLLLSNSIHTSVSNDNEAINFAS
jgi:hypothetical protein